MTIHLSDEKREYIRTHYYTQPASKIAKALGISKSKVLREVTKMALAKKSTTVHAERRPMTETEAAFIREKAGKLTTSAIALELQRSEESVRMYAKRQGISLQRQSRYSLDEDTFLHAHYGTMPNQEIAQVLDRTQESVRARAKVLGYTGGRNQLLPPPSSEKE